MSGIFCRKPGDSKRCALLMYALRINGDQENFVRIGDTEKEGQMSKTAVEPTILHKEV